LSKSFTISITIFNGLSLWPGMQKFCKNRGKKELKNIRFTSPDSIKKADSLKAVIIADKAIIHFADRFAILAAEMASKEKDQTRKKELERIAATCRWVPAHPARDFYDAMQSFYFIFAMIIWESPH
jgi:formate C-acetyltransferase